MKFRAMDEGVDAAAQAAGLSVSSEESCELECKYGVCVGGECFCKPGYSGSDCSINGTQAEHLHSALADSLSGAMDEAGAFGDHAGTTAAAAAAEMPSDLAPSSGSSVSYFLLSALSFIGGVVACIAAQLAYSRYKQVQRQKKTNEIFKPLINSVE